MKPTPLRVCKKCGQAKPATKEHFYVFKKNVGGLEWSCIPCRLDYMSGRWRGVIDQEAHKKASAKWLREHPEAAAKHKATYRGDWIHRILNDKGRASTMTYGHIDSMWWQQNGRCYWTGVPMLTNVRRPHPQLVSMDKLVPAHGYVPDNVVLACFQANMGRQDATVEQMLSYCALLRKSIRAATPAELAQSKSTVTNTTIGTK